MKEKMRERERERKKERKKQKRESDGHLFTTRHCTSTKKCFVKDCLKTDVGAAIIFVTK